METMGRREERMRRLAGGHEFIALVALARDS
jgi:hypothetical protein